jgi:hypothetical protein
MLSPTGRRMTTGQQVKMKYVTVHITCAFIAFYWGFCANILLKCWLQREANHSLLTMAEDINAIIYLYFHPSTRPSTATPLPHLSNFELKSQGLIMILYKLRIRKRKIITNLS